MRPTRGIAGAISFKWILVEVSFPGRLAEQLSQASFEKTMLSLRNDVATLQKHCAQLKEQNGKQDRSFGEFSSVTFALAGDDGCCLHREALLQGQGQGGSVDGQMPCLPSESSHAARASLRDVDA